MTALCLLLFPACAAADLVPIETPIPGYQLRPFSEDLIVYAAQNLKSNIVGYITPDGKQQVHVLSVSNGWCYICFSSVYGTSYGYIPTSFFNAPALATPSPTPAPTLNPGVVAWVLNVDEGYRLNLRSEPSVSAASLGKYYTGTEVILTGQTANGFAQVLLYGSLLGWMDAAFLTTDAADLVPETPVVTIENPGSGAVLRSGPSTDYSRNGWFTHDSAVTVLGVRSDGWYHVLIGQTSGYISEDLLSGTFSYDHGLDSDNPAVNNHQPGKGLVQYINTRTSGGKLHLRKESSSSSASLGLFLTGTPVTVISYTRSGWAYVRIGQSEGFMDADYLTAVKPTQYGEVRTIQNTRATGLNLRSIPSTGGERLAFADNYSQVIVLGELNNSWCYVQYQGQLGYMLGTSLK